MKQEQNPNFSQLVQNLENKNKEQRVKAAKELAKLGDLNAVPYLISALNKEPLPKGNVSTVAADAIMDALGSLKDARAVEPILRWLGTPTNAAINLGRLGDGRVFNDLVNLLNGDPDISWTGTYGLAYLKDPRGFEILVNSLWRGEATDQKSAAEALSIYGDPAAIEPLIQRLEDEKSAGSVAEDVEVQIAIINALLNFRTDRILKPAMNLLKRKYAGMYSQPLSLKQLKNIRVKIVQALAQVDDKSAIKPITNVLLNEEEHKDTRIAAMQTLVTLEDNQIIPKLETVIRSENSDVKDAATKLIQQLLA